MDFDITCGCHRHDVANATITGTVTMSDEAMAQNGISFEKPEDKERFELALSLCIMDLVAMLGRVHVLAPQAVAKYPDIIVMFYRLLGQTDRMEETERMMEEIEAETGHPMDDEAFTQLAKTFFGVGEIGMAERKTSSGIIVLEEASAGQK